MDKTTFIALVNNVALLLSLALFYNITQNKLFKTDSTWRQLFNGFVSGTICVLVMLNPFVLVTGIVFDTRSILISASGLFFGIVPAAITALMSAAYRLHMGGSGTLMGISVIAASAALGILWRHAYRKDITKLSWFNLYALGIAVHISMLLLMSLLPGDSRLYAFGKIGLPVILLFPLGTVFLGKIFMWQFESEQTARALQRSESVLKETQQIARVGGWEYNPRTGKLFWTDEVYRIHEISRAEYDPESINRDFSFYAPEDRTLIENAFNKGLEEGIPYDLTLRFTTAKGNSLWVRTIGNAEKNDGKVIRLYGYIADVTERKNADEEIENYREHLEELVKERTDELTKGREMLYTLIDSLPDEIYAKDIDGRFILANRNVLNSFGISSFGKLMGKTDFDFLPREAAERENEKERSVLSPDGQIINYIEHGKNKYGEERWLSVTKVPMRDINGNVAGLVGINSDITGLKVTEEKSVKAKEEAEIANKAKSKFLSSMSHEIRTPLNAILGFSELMQMDVELSQKHIKWIKTINQSGEHLLTLINDILEISRIEAGRITFNPVSFNLVFLLREIESMFRLKAESKGIQLVLDVSNGLPAVVVTDQIKLRQILINLTGNAVKFTNEGTVTISAHGKKTGEKFGLTVKVEDTGPGIDEKGMKLLFRKFGQTDDGIKEGGTGLGLAISQEYARIMGGVIKVISEERVGSSFVLTVDVDKGEEFVRTEDTKKQVIGLKPGQKKYKVLIVAYSGESCHPFRVLPATFKSLTIPVTITNQVAGNFQNYFSS